MKKFTKIVAFALVLVMSVAVFASCAKTNEDYEKAKEVLRDAGYVVESNAGEWPDLLADLEGAIHAYKIEAGTENEKNPKADDGIVIYYFKNAEAATAAEESLKSDFDSAKKKIDNEIKKGRADESLAIFWGKSEDEKVIYYGTQAAIDCVFNSAE